MFYHFRKSGLALTITRLFKHITYDPFLTLFSLCFVTFLLRFERPKTKTSRKRAKIYVYNVAEDVHYEVRDNEPDALGLFVDHLHSQMSR